MWFKTRFGLVSFEGTVEFRADRWERPRIGKCVGVYAYQSLHPEVARKRLFRKPEQSFNRKIYLACIPDDGSNDKVLDCMRRIETAVRTGAAICDLSDVGTAGAWGAPDYGVMVNWSGRD